MAAKLSSNVKERVNSGKDSCLLVSLHVHSLVQDVSVSMRGKISWCLILFWIKCIGTLEQLALAMTTEMA